MNISSLIEGMDVTYIGNNQYNVSYREGLCLNSVYFKVVDDLKIIISESKSYETDLIIEAIYKLLFVYKDNVWKITSIFPSGACSDIRHVIMTLIKKDSSAVKDERIHFNISRGSDGVAKIIIDPTFIDAYPLIGDYLQKHFEKHKLFNMYGIYGLDTYILTDSDDPIYDYKLALRLQTINAEVIYFKFEDVINFNVVNPLMGHDYQDLFSEIYRTYFEVNRVLYIFNGNMLHWREKCYYVVRNYVTGKSHRVNIIHNANGFILDSDTLDYDVVEALNDHIIKYNIFKPSKQHYLDDINISFIDGIEPMTDGYGYPWNITFVDQSHLSLLVNFNVGEDFSYNVVNSCDCEEYVQSKINSLREGLFSCEGELYLIGDAFCGRNDYLLIRNYETDETHKVNIIIDDEVKFDTECLDFDGGSNVVSTLQEHFEKYGLFEKYAR